MDYKLGKTAVDLDPLDRIGWLAEQPDDFKRWVASVAKWRNYRKGQSMYLAGDPSDGLYGLAAGAVELTFPLVAEEPVSVYRGEIGFWIGDSAELSGETRIVTLSAASACRILHIPHHVIGSHLHEKPQHWQCFYRLSHLNAKTSAGLLAETLSLTARARICRRLLKLGEASEEVKLTHEGLAKTLGLARPTVGTELTRLAAEGAVRIGYGEIQLLDRAVLSRLQNEQ